MAKLKFQQLNLLQSSVSHDISEINIYIYLCFYLFGVL